MSFLKYVLGGAAAVSALGLVGLFAFAQVGPPAGMGPGSGHGMGQGMERGVGHRGGNSSTNTDGDMSGMHQRMMQNMRGGGGMHPAELHSGGGMRGIGRNAMGAGSGDTSRAAGQAAFGAIAEVVAMLEADPATDWSKVNVAALREHLIDMDEVTLRAYAEQSALDNGVEIAVTGAGRTLAAIKRMVPAHVSELVALGWQASTDELPNGIKLTVTSADPAQVAKLKAIGFIGQGGHHQPHHLMMAKGEIAH